MVSPLLGNSDDVLVSVSIDFPTNSKRDAPFHRIVYEYSRADWDGHVPWEDIFKLMNLVNGFRLELMYISFIVSVKSNLTHLHGFQQLVLLR